MASKILYPPIVDSYMPAFKAGTSVCRIYFSLSKFNSNIDFTSVHASIVKQNTGMNVVKTSDSNGKYRSTGIILNLRATKVVTEDNLYYIEIENDDLKSISGSYSGWIPGWIYKVQIRLSSSDYDNSIGQAAWLNAHAGDFSEWSTICVVKATGQINYDIPILDIDTRDSNKSIDEEKTLFLSTLELFGSFYKEEDPSELIKNYQFILYDENDNILEESGLIYNNQYQDNDNFNYTFRQELKENKVYKLSFIFETINHYIGGFYLDNNKDDRLSFTVSQIIAEDIDCIITTADDDIYNLLQEKTSVALEEDEGRIGLKLYSPSNIRYNGNLCIRRTDSSSNFKIWDDIKIIVIKNDYINNLDIIFDYTIESGIWYKYGVQIIDTNGNRGILNEIDHPIMRNFNYSFLLGQNNQQLKLMFDNNMESFRYQLSDSVIETIGGTYPIIARNGAVKYKTFPINGLISFWMDENNLFCDKKTIYNYNEVIDLYNNYNSDKAITQYDYIYERDFRQQVLEFLQDGNFKLFKSPTEGNIIVRLVDINCSPVQSLDRIIYHFSGTAYEMAESSMKNYLQYGFYTVGQYEINFATTEVKLGQLYKDFSVGTNIFQEIYEKYDGKGKNIGGNTRTVTNIYHIKITFNGEPMRVINSAGEYVIGYNFSLNGKIFTIKSPNNIYEFDDRLIYTMSDNLIILGDSENKNSTIPVIIDFLYEIETDVYQDKIIQTQQAQTGTGQIIKQFKPSASIYNEIIYKYYIETDRIFRKINNINSIEIEAKPGVLIQISDKSDENSQIHEINETGQLFLDDLEIITKINYLGVRDENAEDGINKNINSDISINYYYTLVSGTYKET